MIKFIIILHFFIGIGAMAGGIGAMLNPDAPMGMSVDLLSDSPFHNYFVPGLVLFFFIGVLNLVSGILYIRKNHFGEYGSLYCGIIQIFFIIIQCLILWVVTPLHVIFFVFGIIQIVIGVLQIRKEYHES